MSNSPDPARLEEVAKRAEALDGEAVQFHREGRRTEAADAAMQAVGLWRELKAAVPESVVDPHLARGLNNLVDMLSELGRREEALAAAEEALLLYRTLARANPQAFTPDLATSLNNLGTMLSALGRREEALAATEEALALRRTLARDNPQAFTPGLAMSTRVGRTRVLDLKRRSDSLLSKSERLLADGAYPLAEAGASEAVLNLRELAATVHFGKQCLAYGLKVLSRCQAARGHCRKAVSTCEEAAALYREVVAEGRRAFLQTLADCVLDLGVLRSKGRRRGDALRATQEAVRLYRELVAENREGFLDHLATGLHNLGANLSCLGRHQEALAAFRECGSCILQIVPDDPYRWSQLAGGVVRCIDAAQDLRRFHLPCLALLTEHRELAATTEHAHVLLDLQAKIAARVWDVLANLPAAEGDLLDAAVASLVASLQSPDLARWLDARGGGDGPLAKLAELKREVIEAEQLLAALRKGLPGGDDGGWRTGSSGPGTETQRDALVSDLDRQSSKAQALRQAFREERARLVAEDPRFASAFEPIGPQALRSIARHAQGLALLCVLQLGGGAHGQPQPSSLDQRRSVAALLYADGRRTQLLELVGVHELAWHALNHRPEALGRAGRGPLRGAPVAGVRSSSDDPAPPPISDLLAPRMSQSFWTPLQQALQASGVAVERLHVCLHGTMQQLPLAMRQESDCAGLSVAIWPGLPYLRRAALAVGTGAHAAVGVASSPWLVGHDCAWGSEQPLPMVAVEAALLRDLLQRHGQPVQAIERAAELNGQPLALVACCHGGAEQAQFDHALHLGAEPLTVRQIVQDNIGPPLALLPACHAGRTDEDAAGNALGVAAAFMLSGTKVVSASSKAVPDLLQPWLSTLTVWHAMQGLPHHEAATLAREQFARLEFPEGYRSWLQEALPEALATIQPGGEEAPHIRGVHAHLALEQVQERWPWEGDTKHIFHADGALRHEATRSVAEGILRPRGGEEGARALAAEAREMAAFVFVYGVAPDGARQGDAARAAA